MQPSLHPAGASASVVAARLNWIVALAAAAAVGLVVAVASGWFNGEKSPVATIAAGPPPAMAWIAAAPGRVEPRTGEIQITAGMLGRVSQVLVAVNDKVEAGEMMIRLDDDEVRARLVSAESEAGARRRERDSQPVAAGRDEVRRAEDAVYAAHRAVAAARFELDDAVTAKRKAAGGDTEQRLTEARKHLQDAQDRLQREEAALAAAQAKPGLPVPTRLESTLTAARADVEVAESLLDKTRVRAPIDGTVLQLSAKSGELVAPSPERPLVVLGDLTVMRVKAELDERDVGKLKLGQKAFVRSDSFPGKEFEGHVSMLAPSLASQKLGSRGPRRPNDVEVLEVTIDLDGTVPLLPGMRVDAFFRKE